MQPPLKTRQAGYSPLMSNSNSSQSQPKQDITQKPNIRPRDGPSVTHTGVQDRQTQQAQYQTIDYRQNQQYDQNQSNQVQYQNTNQYQQSNQPQSNNQPQNNNQSVQSNQTQQNTQYQQNKQYQQNTFQPQNPYQQPGQNYFQDFQSSATGQIGMQIGTQAFNQAQQQISSNMGRYFDIVQWRYFFDVSNSYVLNKLRLLLFPFIHKSWTRNIENGEDQVAGFAPPRSDLNAPDLYIPVMSFVTYVLIVAIAAGIRAKNSSKFLQLKKGFHPTCLD